MHLHKIELTEQLAHLPDPIKLNPAAAQSLGGYELGVFVLGFEQRGVAIPELLENAGVTLDKARYLTYATNDSDNRANEATLGDYLGKMTNDLDEMPGDNPEFSGQFEGLVSNLPTQDEKIPRVLLDISVASDRLIMRCMKGLINTDVDLTIHYSEAAEYHPTQEEWASEPDEWTRDDRLGLESGVGDLDYSIEYPGHNFEPLPEFLFLFPSFSHERSQAIINAVDPTLGTDEGRERIVWLMGEPHLPADAWRLDAVRSINQLGEQDQQRPMSTFEYKSVLRELDSIYRDVCMDHRVTLSPMGSKLQTLGASLFCYMHPDVRVVLATPKVYNADRYSRGCKAMWSLHFGPTARIREVLDAVGSLTLV